MIEFKDLFQIIKKNLILMFSDYTISVKKIRNNEIGFFINREGFIFEKTKNENSMKIFLHKIDKVDIMLRSFMIVYGSEEEKVCFEKGYNKFFYDTEDDIIGILQFLRNAYDEKIKIFFENDNMYNEIKLYFEYLKKQNNICNKSLENVQKNILESLLFSSKVRFSKEGKIRFM